MVTITATKNVLGVYFVQKKIQINNIPIQNRD